MPRIFKHLEAGCIQVNLMSTSGQINQLIYTILYKFYLYFSLFVTTKRKPCQYQLLTPCDYVWCRCRVAKVQGSGANDPGSIPWSDFVYCNLINIYLCRRNSLHNLPSGCRMDSLCNLPSDEMFMLSVWRQEYSMKEIFYGLRCSAIGRTS